MILADILLWLLVIAGSLTALVASWLAIAAVAPHWTRSCQQGARQHPLLGLVLGMVVALPLVVIAGRVLALAAGPERLIGLLLVGLVLLGAIAGSVGFAGLVGAGLARPGPAEAGDASASRTSADAVLRGGVVLALCVLFPLAGWFLALPALLLGGAGQAVLVLLGILRQRPVAVAAAA